MTLRSATDSTLTRAEFPATELPTRSDRVVNRYSSDVHETYDLPGAKPGSGTGRRLFARAGTDLPALRLAQLRNALTGADTSPDPVAEVDPWVVLTADVHETFDLPGTAHGSGRGRRLVGRAGTRMRRSQLDALYPPAQITAVVPSSGPAAGGNTAQVQGTNLGDVSAVTFGGVAAAITGRPDANTLVVTVPAHAAGAVTVAVDDDSGFASKVNAYTYSA